MPRYYQSLHTHSKKNVFNRKRACVSARGYIRTVQQLSDDASLAIRRRHGVVVVRRQSGHRRRGSISLSQAADYKRADAQRAPPNPSPGGGGVAPPRARAENGDECREKGKKQASLLLLFYVNATILVISFRTSQQSNISIINVS